ncbi:MAG: universal stress protein [Flavobacteriales bacterium]|nr:universal stress protein [Flavobacteriales bacterium]
MLEKDILCATDLTPVSDAALRAAQAIAARFSTGVTLLHVLDRNERSAEGREKVSQAMNAQVANGGASARITPKLLEGDFMKAIATESGEGHALLTLGTHGARGLRQNLFGADILKLVRHAATPSLVVQEGLNEAQLLQRIVLPVASHSEVDRLLDMVVALAKGFAADVHVYQLNRPGETPSPELLANKQKMIARLHAENLRHEEVNEPSTAFSIGFADATIRYAERVGAGAIAIMAHASDEYRYIADAEKERILANEPRIPVLCA